MSLLRSVALLTSVRAILGCGQPSIVPLPSEAAEDPYSHLGAIVAAMIPWLGLLSGGEGPGTIEGVIFDVLAVVVVSTLGQAR